MDSDPLLSRISLTRRAFLRLGAGGAVAALTLSIPLVSALAAQQKKKESLDAPITLPPRKPQAPRLLMIDPGHGGHDPGAIGLNGIQEKDVTLDIAQRMADALIPMIGIDVKLTRERDVFLPLQERVRLAQSMRSDLFVSIHADSAPNKIARGLSVYTLSEKASDQFAGALAERENNADILGGIDLNLADQEVAAILFDLTARRTRNTAQRTKHGFVKAIGKKWHLLENPMRSANFAVLRAPDVPSLLIETGFLSNPEDEKLLSTPKQRIRIGETIANELSRMLQGPLFA